MYLGLNIHYVEESEKIYQDWSETTVTLLLNFIISKDQDTFPLPAH